jgi:hypothetical protein
VLAYEVEEGRHLLPRPGPHSLSTGGWPEGSLGWTRLQQSVLNGVVQRGTQADVDVPDRLGGEPLARWHLAAAREHAKLLAPSDPVADRGFGVSHFSDQLSYRRAWRWSLPEVLIARRNLLQVLQMFCTWVPGEAAVPQFAVECLDIRPRQVLKPDASDARHQVDTDDGWAASERPLPDATAAAGHPTILAAQAGSVVKISLAFGQHSDLPGSLLGPSQVQKLAPEHGLEP